MTLNELKHLWRKSQSDLIFIQATALAYTTLLSLIPILAVAFYIFQAFGGLNELATKIQPLIEQNLAPAFSERISEYVTGIMKKTNAGSIGIFGLIGFVATSIMTITKIEQSFNNIWGVQRTRGFTQRITTYWSLLTIGPIFLAASLILSSKAMGYLRSDSGEISRALLWVFTLTPYVTSGFLFTFIFYFIPNTAVHKRDALKAGAITGLIFECAKLIYARYATATLTKSSIYGSLAILPVFLLWLYVVWLIVLFGAELCCYFKFKRLNIPYRFRIGDRLNPFILSDILEDLANSGKAVRGGLTMSELLASLRLPMNELTNHLEFLEEEGWIVSTQLDILGERKYYLAVNRDVCDMGQIMEEIEDQRYQPRSPHGIAIHKKFTQLWKEWTLETAKNQKDERNK